MTRTNLSVHLGWLLDQGPSLYPSLNSTARSNEVHQVSRPFALHQAEPPRALAEVPDNAQLRTSADIDDVLEECGSDTIPYDDRSNTDMARLSLAPQSSSKPRMFLQNDKALSRSPKTPSYLSSKGAATSPHSSRRRRAAKGMIQPTS